jgi:hypothetical protein
MKLFYAIAVTALLSASAAFAQTTATAPDTASPTTSVTPGNGTPTLATCRKQASDKKLTGSDRKQYVHDCRAGKAPS